ncbi:cerberus [Hemicordylus capensis]|uniref:cerberus n=1 Tax=Hemicordylus capensis TaxID=884348 RepID=UPI0023020AFB|nr:cerberus [Hemicordylus capensis]
MLLVLLQVLLISMLGIAEQTGKEQQKRKRRIPYLLPQDRDLLVEDLVGYEGILTKPGLFMANQGAETKKQDDPRRSKFLFPYVDSHAAHTLGSQAPTSESLHSDSTKRPLSHPHSRREVELPFRKDARRFWDHFMLKTKSRSEEVILPIKTNEMYQETCSTLPFSQSIVHENCENVVIQNNLCFGKCSSFHVPGPEDRLYTFCSHCLPTKFSMEHLEMNCSRATPIIKVVMVVEECKCEGQKTKRPGIGFLHSDLYANVYEHN